MGSGMIVTWTDGWVGLCVGWLVLMGLAVPEGCEVGCGGAGDGDHCACARLLLGVLAEKKIARPMIAASSKSNPITGVDLPMLMISPPRIVVVGSNAQRTRATLFLLLLQRIKSKE